MPVLPAIGAAAAGAFASVAGAATALAPIISTASGIVGLLNTARGAQQQAQLPQIQKPPALPSPELINTQETQKILKANAKRTKTILTSPLSDTGNNNGIIFKKTLGGS